MYVRPNGNGTVCAGTVRITAYQKALLITVLSNPPTPILWAPLTAAYTNGTNILQVATDEIESTVYATLADAPPSGTPTNLTLSGATVYLLLRATGSGSTVLANKGRIVSATLGQVAYDLQSADIALLTPGWYKASFKIVFPSGQVREFVGIWVLVVPPAA